MDFTSAHETANTCAQTHRGVWFTQGLFNFKPSVRPVPLEAHIQGYPGKFYCPRMASMNKPAYAAIQVSCCMLLFWPSGHQK